MKLQTTRGRLLASTLFAGVATFAVPATVAVMGSMVATSASAQDLTSGILNGHVVNSAGAGVAGAAVRVTSNERGFTQTATTDANGQFRIPQVPIGTYTVSVTAGGYQGFTDRNVAVNLGSAPDYEFPLAGGAGSDTAVSELVVVGSARSPSVDFDRVTTGAVVNVQQSAERLPVSRDIQGIVNLVPQISINQAFATTANPIALPSISGSSAAENIYYINGMNVTNFRNFLGGSTIPFAFYDQVEVKTGGYSAEFGRSTGGAIIAVSRSGSNTFHGGIEGYWEPQDLREAAPPTAITSTLSGGKYNNSYNLGLENKNKNYEGDIWLSGPIWKDHLFFFGFYNPRHSERVVGQSSSLDSTANAFTNNEPDVYDVVKNTKPFWGGKIDLNVTDSQRLEFTYFKDNQNAVDENYVNNGAGFDKSITNNFSGGENKIVRYTGRFTDWFTLSALYGESAFNQSSVGELDSQAAVFQNGALVRGNPNLLIQTGEDTRKNYRVDGDFYFNLVGDHHVRIGYDRENLKAEQVQSYSGGVYYRLYNAGTNCGSSGTVTNFCVRVRNLQNSGGFSTVQQAIYIQDAWDVTDRLSLQLGVRGEDFNNKNSTGGTFIHTKHQIAPRIGLTYDVLGDKRTKVSAFVGRYHLPIAANTNIRQSGNETFQEDFYTYTALNPTTLVPTLGTRLVHNCLEGTDTGSACIAGNPGPGVLASKNLKPQFQDEFILGLQHQFDTGWTFGANFIYRNLKSVLEDTNLDSNVEPSTGRSRYCVYANISAAQCGSFGNSGYVLVNPGRDAVLTLNDTWGSRSGQTVTIPEAVIGLPKARREYIALEMTFNRPFDGKWGLDGSYVLSESKGNYEGGVKSDNGQPDTGGTQDFDEVGWMDNSFGLLPNHHAHQFKLHGVYQPIEHLTFGASLNVQSPRHYGCIGYYPLTDGRADQTTLTAWYCNALGSGGVNPTPRGSQFAGDWVKRLDLTISYDLQLPIAGALQLRADVFNVLNSKDAIIMDEFGETGGLGTRNYAYGTPSLYQTPRYVRVGFNYRF